MLSGQCRSVRIGSPWPSSARPPKASRDVSELVPNYLGHRHRLTLASFANGWPKVFLEASLL